MKTVYVALMCVFLLVGCDSIKGPTGPAGKNGEDGLDIAVYTGVLTSGGLVKTGLFYTDYWSIYTGKKLEDCFVSVLAREGSSSFWRGIAWDFSGTYIYLYYSGDVKPGWEYKILIAE